MAQYRRTVPELLARYELEPTLRDVYVEGSFDSDLLRWFFRRCDLPDVVVYEIDTVDIDDRDVVAAGLPAGMWGRVVWLATDLGRHLRPEDLQATLVADRDVTGLLGALREHPHLFYTDYSCVEMYLVAEEPLQKFLELVAGGAPHSAEQLRSMIGAVALEAALLRAAKLILAWGLPSLSLDRFCSVVDGELVFDRAAMITRTLLAGGHGGELVELEAEIEKLRPAAGDDFRVHSSGHDFIDLLAFYLRRIANVSGYRAEFVHRSLLACAEFPSLEGEPMFQALAARFSQPAAA